MEHQGKSLAISASGLALLDFEKRLCIIESALQITSKEAVDFLKKHPAYAMKIILQYYPIDLEFIETIWDKINTPRLGQQNLFFNKFIHWDEQFLDKFKDKFSWRMFGSRYRNVSSSIWSLSLMSRFAEYLNWEVLCQNPTFPWTEGLIDYFSHKIDWAALSRHSQITSNFDLINRYRDKWNWYSLFANAPLTENIIHTFEPYINWDAISHNENFSWSYEFIKKNEDRFDWSGLSENQSLPWSLSFFSEFEDRWNFKSLSYIKNLPWSINFIEKYIDRWNWDDNASLSSNSNLPWSEHLILKYWDRWNLQDICAGMEGPWNIDLIQRILDDSTDYWSDLAWNDNLPWSIELLERYSHLWVEPPLNQGLYEKVFSRHITEDLVKDISNLL
jgi:hypothetical protein